MPGALDIGVVGHRLVRGDGEGRVMLELVRQLAEQGHSVHVYTSELDEQLAPSVTWRPMPHVPGPRLLADAALFVRASLATRSSRHDVVVITGACAWPPQPYVLYAHFSHRGWRRSWSSGGRPSLRLRAHAVVTEVLERGLGPRAAAVIACSRRVGEDLLGTDRADGRLTVVPNGVDLDEHSLVTVDERVRCRRLFGVPADAFVVAFLGEYRTGRKGLVPLLGATGRGPADEHLVVAGTGSAGWLAERARQLGMGDRVHAVGHAPAAQVLATADVVAVPSHYEPFSLVAVEAAARGVPVVASAQVGAVPWLGDGVVTVERVDPVLLRRALDQVRHDGPGTRGAAGRRAVARLGWRETTASAAGVVERVAGERRLSG